MNRVNKFELFIDANKFLCKLTIKKYFLKKGVETAVYDNKKKSFKVKSDFFPWWEKGPFLETFSKIVCQDFENLEENKVKKRVYNLTRAEQEVLKKLQTRKEWVIRAADKGGGTVIMKREYYETEARRILMDRTTYKILENDPTENFKLELGNLLEEAVNIGIITKENFDFLYPKYPLTQIFYFLPKVHKNIRSPPGRPIISGIDSLTANSSKFIDFYLQPIAQKTKSYIKDSTHILQEIESIAWHSDYKWATLDVTSLYTVIKHELGIEAIVRTLESQSTLETNKQIFLKSAIRFILENIFLGIMRICYFKLMVRPCAPGSPQIMLTSTWPIGRTHIFGVLPYGGRTWCYGEDSSMMF
uniref:Reverse transcriptase domain-containing protein n=1 Tax=Leptobrachium leishanense TaxID=445787 RepID=A0A8C5MLR3_9ANUR